MPEWLVTILDINGSAPMTGPRVGQLPQLSKVYEAKERDAALAQAWAEWDEHFQGYRPSDPSVTVELRRA